MKTKCASEWLAAFGGFILNIVLLAKSHSPNVKDQQGWQNRNRSLINTVCLIALYYISSDNRWTQGCHWGATLNPGCIKKQIPPSQEIPACMAQTSLWSFPSPITGVPVKIFASVGLRTKIAQRRVYVTRLLRISFKKKENQNKTSPTPPQSTPQPHPLYFYLPCSVKKIGKCCYPAEFNSTLSCCNTDKYSACLLEECSKWWQEPRLLSEIYWESCAHFTAETSREIPLCLTQFKILRWAGAGSKSSSQMLFFPRQPCWLRRKYTGNRTIKPGFQNTPSHYRALLLNIVQ